MEIWKDIQGFEGLYMVSNLGNVKSLNYSGRGIEKNIKFKKHKKGYLQVELHKNGKSKTITVHRLVANAFIPKENDSLVVNHKNENKTDNNVENLEWVTSRENVIYSINAAIARGEKRKRTVKVSSRTHNYNSCNQKVEQLDLLCNKIRTWENPIEIKHELGYSDWSIKECCKGNRKTAYGYKWRYAI